jgi:hypothetical protein
VTTLAGWAAAGGAPEEAASLANEAAAEGRGGLGRPAAAGEGPGPDDDEAEAEAATTRRRRRQELAARGAARACGCWGCGCRRGSEAWPAAPQLAAACVSISPGLGGREGGAVLCSLSFLLGESVLPFGGWCVGVCMYGGTRA